MPIPLLGLGLSALGGVAKKLAGKALKAATKGKLLGAGGGKELLKTAAKGAVATVGGTVLTSTVTRALGPSPVSSLPSQLPSLGGGEMVGYESGGRRYTKSGKLIRTMNPLNIRALRKAIRRVGSAERIFKQVFTISGGKVTPRTKRRGR